MEIQRLRGAQWQRLRSVRLAALAEAPEAFGSTLADAERLGEADWREQLERLATFVAVDVGEDVGMARGSLHDGDAGDAYLISMWVAPQARGRGIGAALIHAVVTWAAEAGCRRVLLDVADDNRAAVALYRQAGFVPTGRTGALPPPRSHVREHQRALPLEARSAGGVDGDHASGTSAR